MFCRTIAAIRVGDRVGVEAVRAWSIRRARHRIDTRTATHRPHREEASMSTDTYHVTVGPFDCVAVCDGVFTYPASTLFVNAASDRLDCALRAHHLPAHEITTSYSCLVVMAGRHRVLVDTGAGRLVPSTGQLLARLHEEGIAPGDIDTVILSHGHPAQISGATDGEGTPTFPNARYVMARDEWAF